MAEDRETQGARDHGRSLAMGLAAGLALWGLVFLAGLSPFGASLENMALDAAYALRSRGDRPPGLLVVAVDEPSFQAIGLPWPWPRRLHAKLLTRLHAAGARLVVLDMVFAEPSGPPGNADDAALAGALGDAGPVVLAMALDTADDPAFARQILVPPLPLFRDKAAGAGLAVLTPDRDGAIRRFATRHAGLPTLAGAALRLLAKDGAVPDAKGLIDFPGPARTIDTVSYADVIDPDRPLPAEHIRDRVVVVGRSLAASAAPLGQADTFATPLSRVTGQPTPGPEIQAAILYTMLRGAPGREIPLAAMLGFGGCLLPVAGAVLFRLRPVPAAASALGLAAGLLALSAGLFVWRFVWAPPMLLAGGLTLAGAAATLYRGLEERREKRFLARAFSRYLAPQVVRDLINRPELLELGGREAEVTVFFSDLAGFTSFSETLSPKELIGLLNAWFTPATDIILRSGGTLDKFIGDAIMAFWGAPLADPAHAAKALGAALALRDALASLSRDFADRGLPVLDARMGLHAGPAVVGNVGSRERFDYTVLGDTVNLASRLESLNKYYGTRILATEAVVAAAGPGFVCREVDRVRVKGRERAVTVFEPLGRAGEPGAAFAATFEAARRLYAARRFEDALAGFLAADAARPPQGDPPSRVFAVRCREHLLSPPPPDWDGVFAPTGK
ncbi:adenylate/guanylate cyclase with Chase sensor [Solidesulfovibrio carbinoliphilus subsp. oakridgensis]|uniref:Adenylate/guanylate cyclase with Chase sensor n=1 Tax=Solidesulfovibrio carbinoliphilus subsp. oakridgensis TaxID=694327 RepID=G7Q6J3_9BACT|nr:adenylate/guanylate cyclase domain-containing protein [Solidesulfovibrio carbinoliphilus]EHJ47606.1 adenylate/guanylate cyclase with Chase sensor [Solidesulfovibrio carbinoliphilus subsp. oakridgensis]